MKDIFGNQMQQMTGNLRQQAGGVGADRIAVGQSELARQQGLAAGQTLSDAWNRSAQQAQGAAFGMGSLGPATQASALQGAQALLGTGLYAQKAQTDFKEKLRWASEDGDAAVACSADGKYVYVAGGEGVLASDNFGQTGSWTLVLKGK